MSSDDSYLEVRDELFPGLSKALQDRPLDHAGDVAELDVRLRRLWNAAMDFASRKTTKIKRNDQFSLGYNKCSEDVADALERSKVKDE